MDIHSYVPKRVVIVKYKLEISSQLIISNNYSYLIYSQTTYYSSIHAHTQYQLHTYAHMISLHKLVKQLESMNEICNLDYIHTFIHIHTYIHRCTHIHTYTHTHTHTHTHRYTVCLSAHCPLESRGTPQQEEAKTCDRYGGLHVC